MLVTCKLARQPYISVTETQTLFAVSEPKTFPSSSSVFSPTLHLILIYFFFILFFKPNFIRIQQRISRYILSLTLFSFSISKSFYSLQLASESRFFLFSILSLFSRFGFHCYCFVSSLIYLSLSKSTLLQEILVLFYAICC